MSILKHLTPTTANQSWHAVLLAVPNVAEKCLLCCSDRERADGLLASAWLLWGGWNLQKVLSLKLYDHPSTSILLTPTKQNILEKSIKEEIKISML